MLKVLSGSNPFQSTNSYQILSIVLQTGYLGEYILVNEAISQPRKHLTHGYWVRLNDKKSNLDFFFVHVVRTKSVSDVKLIISYLGLADAYVMVKSTKTKPNFLWDRLCLNNNSMLRVYSYFVHNIVLCVHVCVIFCVFINNIKIG